MSRIRGKDTKPELLVRKELHAHGFRFRLQDRNLPGRPDIVLAKYGVAIMVNGCFWHSHRGCQYATKPRSNVEFWETKIARNKHRDEVTSAHLEALGWRLLLYGNVNFVEKKKQKQGYRLWQRRSAQQEN